MGSRYKKGLPVQCIEHATGQTTVFKRVPVPHGDLEAKIPEAKTVRRGENTHHFGAPKKMMLAR
ncbi:MAG: hypothetical protein WCZ20_06455 [Hydrogenophaga sp.]|nr:hypothetical protein [Gammaproteobacteria bacterium]